MLSKAFKTAYKLYDGPRYRLALGAGANPAWVSKIVHDAAPVQIGDPRVIAIGQQLGLRPHECFAPMQEEAQDAHRNP